MDLEQLLANIAKARDAAKSDAAKYRRMGEDERAALGGVQGAAANAGRNSVATALDIVEVTLSRILGEAPTSSDSEKQAGP